MNLLFFNIGAPEIFMIILFVIIFFGAKRIPDIARGLGKGIKEFKNATGEIQREIHDSSRDIRREANLSHHLQDEERKESKGDDSSNPVE